MAPVLLIGLDPRKIAGFDPAPVELAIALGQQRFVEAGIEVDTCLVAIDAAAPAIIEERAQTKAVRRRGRRRRDPEAGRPGRTPRGRDRPDSPSRAAGGNRLQHEPNDERRRGEAADAVTARLVRAAAASAHGRRWPGQERRVERPHCADNRRRAELCPLRGADASWSRDACCATTAAASRSCPPLWSTWNCSRRRSWPCPLCSQAAVEWSTRRAAAASAAPGCFGMLIQMRRFAAVIDGARRARNDVRSHARAASPVSRARGVCTCPACGQTMIDQVYGGPGNVVIDTCERCGVNWLDPGSPNRHGAGFATGRYRAARSHRFVEGQPGHPASFTPGSAQLAREHVDELRRRHRPASVSPTRTGRGRPG